MREREEYVEDPQVTTAKIRSGEYFREAMQWYDSVYHTPMMERCYLIFVTTVSCLTIYYAFTAFTGMFPLKPPAPFITRAADVTRYVPSITPIVNPGEDRHLALARHFVLDYVKARESYNVAHLERGFYRVNALSSPEVFRAFQTQIDPSNPRSPLVMYERHSQRTIDIRSFQLLSNGHMGIKPDSPELAKSAPYRARVIFGATVERNKQRQTLYFAADIAFQFAGITVNQDTYEATPMSFHVTDYSIKPLVDGGNGQ